VNRFHRRAARTRRPIQITLAVMLGGGLLAACASSAPEQAASGPPPHGRLADSGRNPYFVLEPGYRQTYTGGAGLLVVSVLADTEIVDGYTTRVVEERESKGNALVELSRNFYAIDPVTQDVYYFGEDVDDYSHGHVEHPGSWRSGQDGAHFGLMMPGRPTVGFQHDQENAPSVAEDHAEVLSTTETVTGPSGPVSNCLKVKETSRIEPGVTEYKIYAPGVGLVTDEDLTLVGYRR